MSTNKSKFSGIFGPRQDMATDAIEEVSEPKPESALEEPPPSPAPPVLQPPVAQPRQRAKPPVVIAEAPRRVGRPTGKRSDGQHVQVTAYIRKDTHHAVKTALLAEQKDRDFSDLVEDLLTKWLKSRT